MNKKLLLGLLVGSLALGGIAYGASDSRPSSVDYVVKNSSKMGEKTAYNPERYYGHRDLHKGPVCSFLGDNRKHSLDNLSEEEVARLIDEVRDRRNLSYEEAERLLISGDYCYNYDLTREDFEALTDEELDELRKDHYENHKRNYRHREDRDHHGDGRGQHHRGYGRRQENRRGRVNCH